MYSITFSGYSNKVEVSPCDIKDFVAKPSVDSHPTTDLQQPKKRKNVKDLEALNEKKRRKQLEKQISIEKQKSWLEFSSKKSGKKGDFFF